MKKNILFVATSLNVGGAEKSLVNLLNMIDEKKYSVDLLLFQKEGAFLKQVPSYVNFVSEYKIKWLYNTNKMYVILHPFISLKRLVYTLVEKRKWKLFDLVKIHRWVDYYSNIISDLKKEYDVAVAYSGGETTYYVVDKVNAKRKVCYYHSDYSKIEIDSSLELNYVEKTDLIVTISNACAESLKHIFPTQQNKIKVLQNISSPQLINSLAVDYFPNEFDTNSFKIVSIGRLHFIKGFDMAIEASNIMKSKKINFKWYIVGEGKEREKLELLIKKYNLNDNVFLIGLKENPYPYIKNCDLLVQPSRFEGKSLVIDEAKILGVPILATNYNSIGDQIKNNYNGFIVDISPKEIAKGIMNIINSLDVLKKIKSNIKNEISCVDKCDEYMNVLVGDENEKNS